MSCDVVARYTVYFGTSSLRNRKGVWLGDMIQVFEGCGATRNIAHVLVSADKEKKGLLNASSRTFSTVGMLQFHPIHYMSCMYVEDAESKGHINICFALVLAMQ